MIFCDKENLHVPVITLTRIFNSKDNLWQRKPVAMKTSDLDLLFIMTTCEKGLPTPSDKGFHHTMTTRNKDFRYHDNKRDKVLP